MPRYIRGQRSTSPSQSLLVVRQRTMEAVSSDAGIIADSVISLRDVVMYSAQHLKAKIIRVKS